MEHRGRNLLLAGLRAILLRREPRASREINPSLFSKVLIIRTGKALGDALQSLILIPECRRLFPNARLDLMLRDNISPLFQYGTGAGNILVFHPRFLSHPLAMLHLLRQLRRERYDAVIACDNAFKSSFTTLCLALWTGARCRAGFDNEESRAFLSHPVAPSRPDPMISNLLRLLSPFGKTPADAIPTLRPDPALASETARLFRPLKRPALIFAPHHWRKSWPLEAFLRIGERLLAEKIPVLLALGPGDPRADDPALRQWLAAAPDLARLVPPQPLPAFASLLSQCRLFVSNDCGPYHLAAAVGIPCVAAFLSADNCHYFGYHLPGRLIALHHPEQIEAERAVAAACLGLPGVRETA